MTKSKFQLWALLPLILIIMLTGFSALLFYTLFFMPNDDTISLWIYIVVLFVIGFFAITAVWVLAEMRKKAIAVVIDSNSIVVNGFYGLGKKRKYRLNEFDGYNTSLLPVKYGGTYEYLYLMMGRKKVVILSEFYHRNYFELKQVLTGKVKFMGDIKFDMETEIKETVK